MLSGADALVFLPFHGWRVSSDLQMEINWANEWGIPVFWATPKLKSQSCPYELEGLNPEQFLDFHFEGTSPSHD